MSHATFMIGHMKTVVGAVVIGEDLFVDEGAYFGGKIKESERFEFQLLEV